MKKEMIRRINAIAHENIDKALGMLEMYNEINGTDYFILNLRVVYKDHDGLGFRDAWANADN